MRYQETETSYIIAKFDTGDTVTITLYDLSTGNSVSLDSNSCSEVGTTGVFRWATSNITTPPTSYTQYLWIMDVGTEKKYGKVVISGYVDDIDTAISTRAPSGEYDTELDTNVGSRAPANEYDTEMARLDVDVSTRSSHSVADVWDYATRTLSSFGTLVVDIWGYITRTLTVGTKDAEIDDILTDTDEIQSKLPTNNIMGSSVKTDKDDEIDAIKAKADNLPADPASQSDVELAITTAEGNIVGPDSDDLKVISDQLDIVQADLDNPNQYKADVSGLAPASEYDAELANLQTDMTLMKKIESNRWRVVGNQFIIYDDDGVTPLLTFNLKDAGGLPTEDNPRERDPV